MINTEETQPPPQGGITIVTHSTNIICGAGAGVPADHAAECECAASLANLAFSKANEL